MKENDEGGENEAKGSRLRYDKEIELKKGKMKEQEIGGGAKMKQEECK